MSIMNDGSRQRQAQDSHCEPPQTTFVQTDHGFHGSNHNQHDEGQEVATGKQRDVWRGCTCKRHIIFRRWLRTAVQLPTYFYMFEVNHVLSYDKWTATEILAHPERCHPRASSIWSQREHQTSASRWIAQFILSID